MTGTSRPFSVSTATPTLTYFLRINAAGQVDRRVEVGEQLQGDGDRLHRQRGDGQVAAGLFDFAAVLLAHLLERGDVSLVELGDVRNRVPGGGWRCSAVLRRMPVMGLRSISPHLAKSGSAGPTADGAAGAARRGRLAVAAETVHHALGEFLDVILRDAFRPVRCRAPG